MIPAHGHTTVSEIPIGRAGAAQSWFQHLWDRWTAHQAARQEAHLTSLRTRWDASREAVTPCRADAAPEMAAAHGARSAAMLVYSLAV